MGVNYFTDEQVKQLSSNPYVKSMTYRYINYTEEFKELFYEEHSNGKLPKQIFKDCGFDIKALGNERIKAFAKRIKHESNRIEGFTDKRKGKSGRPSVKELTIEEQLEKEKLKNKILSQENDFLKRVRFINKKQILAQSKIKLQNKNSN